MQFHQTVQILLVIRVSLNRKWLSNIKQYSVLALCTLVHSGREKKKINETASIRNSKACCSSWKNRKLTHYTLKYTLTPKISTAIRNTSHPCRLCMDIYMCIYILTHRMHRLIGISSAAVQYINIHVYSHI